MKINDFAYQYIKINQYPKETSNQTTFGSKLVSPQTKILKYLESLGVDKDTINELIRYKRVSGNIDILEIVNRYLNENSYPYLKHIIANNLLCKKEFIKFIFASANPRFKDLKKRNELEELYNNLYLPIINSPKNAALPGKYREYTAGEIICLKLKNPEEFQKLEDLGIIDLIKNGKISLNLLSKYYEGAKFLPEIYDDLDRLRRGESLIRTFDSLTDVIKKTKPGDVIEVKGKMYINNNGKLEPWKMSREKFEELFPPVDRFVTTQGEDDCYLITVLNSLYRNPITRGNYYKMFEQQGNDIYVTIPAYKEYGGKIKFTDGKIRTIKNNAIAAKNVQMLERAYSRLSLRYPLIEGEANYINPLTTRKLTFLRERIHMGLEDETFKEFCIPRGCNIIEVKPDKENAVRLLENYASDPKYIITEGLNTDNGNLHSIRIESYDKSSKIILFTDPETSWQLQRQHLDNFLRETDDIIITRLK